MREIVKGYEKEQMLDLYSAYKRSNNTDNLFCVYESFSDKMYEAFERCRKLMKQYEGKNGKVLWGNTYTFTFGFEGIYNGKEAYFHITAGQDRVIILE